MSIQARFEESFKEELQIERSKAVVVDCSS